MGAVVDATVPLSGTVSGNVDLTRAKALVGIWVPAVISGDLLIRANYDTTSANYVRIQRPLPNTGDMRFASGVGSCWMPWPTDVPAPASIRLEMSVPQDAAKTFKVHFN